MLPSMPVMFWITQVMVLTGPDRGPANTNQGMITGFSTIYECNAAIPLVEVGLLVTNAGINGMQAKPLQAWCWDLSKVPGAAALKKMQAEKVQAFKDAIRKSANAQ